MNKQYESNNCKSTNPFDIALVKKNGGLEDYYILNDDVRKKITLGDLVNAQVAFANGNSTQNASSGDYTRNASSGYNARNASSGDNAQNASSGNSTQNASSGDYTRNASSGYDARNASSGDYTRNASSGDYTRNASSGNSTQNASSGDCTRNEVSGKNSVVFDCGFNSIVKAVNGTWISLCEYNENEEGKIAPSFACSAQIGNPDYVDFKGLTLSGKEFYILKDRKFTPVILDDGVKLIKNSSKMKGEIEIIKCTEINNSDEIFCVRKGDLSAHGKTLKQAMSDLLFKEMQNKDVSEIVEKIKKCGSVTRADYRCITGACSFGTEQFAKEHGYSNVDKVGLSELISKLDDSYYGAVKFKELFE